tara:strand:+ start:970 stop:1332 length:363 start_codon:yes stop_codon:yes gene_type:complete
MQKPEPLWFRAITGPFRMMKECFIFIANMNSKQVRSIFAMALLLGIISLSLMNISLIVFAREEDDVGSLFSAMIQNQQFWNNAMMCIFAVIIGLVVWGATRFNAKYGDNEFSAGTGDTDD